MPLAPGQKLAAYEIISSLGAGGMGEVFRARDTRLGRDVALKILPPDVTNEPGRLERFDREARVIAALNHPHIVTIYSTEEADGLRFLTMELVDGQTLSELVGSNGMSIARFLDIAMPLADALAAAHQKQITHRDLKPGNVMISNDGRVKVLDFGLARVGGPDFGENSFAATAAPITNLGVIVGTMPYMSPEQVEGRAIDARSDLFSLGVIFYELLSGKRPFGGGSSPALMSAILRDTPTPISSTRADLPEGLERLIDRLIEKRPEDRVQTARDVFNELKHLRKHVESSSSGRSASASGSATSTPLQNLWVAVLPFTARGADQDAAELAAGLTDDIAASLAKFQLYNVVAPQSTRAYKDSALDVRQIADRLGARYVIGGNVRTSARAIRTTAQLIDAASGAQLWSESYDRDAAAMDLFAIQDDVTDHIVATIGDQSGVLARSMTKAVRSHLPASEQTSRELMLRAWALRHNTEPAEHAKLREALETRLKTEPDNADLWAELAHLYLDEQIIVINPLPDPLGRALRAARRSVELDPNNQPGWTELAAACFFTRDRAGLFDGGERAIAVNPRNAYTLGWIGNLFAHAGEYERGSKLSERCMAINPRHPGWCHIGTFNKHFAAGDYEAALRSARRVNMPDLNWSFFVVATAAAHLNLMDEAKQAASRMIAITPSLADPVVLRTLTEMWFWQPHMVDALLDGVQRALDALSTEPQRASNDRRKPPSSTSGSMGSGALTVAIRPFVSRSSDEESKALADGLTDDITSGLSKFGYLRVLSRTVAERLASDPSRLHARARYEVEGHVRKSGNQVRIGVTLVDTQTGSNLWTDSRDCAIEDGTFAIQDGVSSAVVATVGDQTGVLMRAMAAAAADRPLDELSVAELVVRYHLYAESFDPREHARLRDAFERALEPEPRAAEGWACLALLYEHEHSFGFNPLPDSMSRERRAAERAKELDPNSQQAWIAMASVHCFARDREAVKSAVERAASINPLNADLLALGAIFLSVTGEDDRACELVQQAMRLKPQHAGWYYYPPFNAAYRRGDYEEALRANKRAGMQRMPLHHINALAVAGQLGLRAEAGAALRILREMDPVLCEPDGARAVWAAWLCGEEFLDSLEEGFRKGLALAGDARAAKDDHPSSRSSAPGSSAGGGLAIAVLPFVARSSDDESKALADGLTDDITSGLSRFGYLRVLSRSIVERLGREHSEIHTHARYAIEGYVRKSGAHVRVGVTLVDTQTGSNLWTENYDRDAAAGIFAIQDDVVGATVATVGDQTGVLVRAMATWIAGKPLAELSVPELIIRYHLYTENFNPVEHAALRDAFERRLEKEPRAAEAWAALAMLYEQEHGLRFNPLPDSLGRQRQAATRAVELNPHSQLGWIAMGAMYGFARDREALKAAIERSVAINPLNADMVALGAIFLSVAGEHDRAAALSRQAKARKPQHPGWYVFPLFNYHFARGEYEEALRENRSVNMPRMPLSQLAAAAVSGHLGRVAEASAAFTALRAINPALTEPEGAKALWSLWLWDEGFIEKLLEGFKRATTLVEERSDDRSSDRSTMRSDGRSTNRSDERSVTSSVLSPVLIAVRELRGGSAAAAAVAEGLATDIATRLAKFPYVRVVAEEVAARSSGDHRYAIQGEVRESGGTIRTNVRLVNLASGAQIWAHHYDSDARLATFDIVDPVADRIVATVADGHGELLRALSQDPALMSHVAIRFFGYIRHVTPEGHASLRDAYEAIVAAEPDSVEGWARLAVLYIHEAMFNYNQRPDPIGRARQAAERSVALDAGNQTAWFAKAIVCYLIRDKSGFFSGAERAIELNPLSSSVTGTLGAFLSQTGETARGAELVRRTISLTPHHRPWFFMALFADAFMKGDADQAFEQAQRCAAAQLPIPKLLMIAAAGRFGAVDTALRAIKEWEHDHDDRPFDLESARGVLQQTLWPSPFLDAMIDGVKRAIAMRSDERSHDRSTSRSDDRSTTRADERSVAVLPFTDLSEKKDQDWFCEGIAEEIMNALAPLPGLRVAARASAFSFRGKANDLATIGEKLRVDTVLEGSVRRSGDRVRITTQLSDTREGRQLWSERFDRELKDIFDVQDQIARAIAGRLRVTIDGGAERLVQKATSNMEAYELLLKARVFLNRRGPAIVNAIPLFEKAIALDPNLADAHAGLGDTYRLFGIYSLMPTREAMQLARTSLERALAIDPDQVEALATLANITSMFDWNYAESRALTERALRKDPSHVRALAESAVTTASSMVDHPSDDLLSMVRERIARARALDPLSAWAMAIEAMVLVLVGRDQEAIETATKAVATDPNNFTAHWARVFTLAQQDRFAEAEDAAQPGLAMSARHPMLLADLATVHARKGEIEKAESIYQELTERSKTAFITPGARAVAAAAAGHMTEARALLAQALADRDAYVVFNKLAAWRPIWDDPECAAMLRNSALKQHAPA